ncbi:hypothetical protein [Thalassospira marina]|uniref:hypothetical protein n=1 Tax=Thalassospira marina TaxID=2048283 RepID=UPI0020C43858|nr:hypothetical protein [Thalassospira marina]
MLDIAGSSLVRVWVKRRGSLRFSGVSSGLFAGDDAALTSGPGVGASFFAPVTSGSKDVSDEAGLLSTVLLAFFLPNMGLINPCLAVSGER